MGRAERSNPLRQRLRARRTVLPAAKKHTVSIKQLSGETLAEFQRRYFVNLPELENRVCYRLTDNWLQLTVRFVVEDRGMHEVMDAMSRDILSALEAAGIEVASATIEVVDLPKVKVEIQPPGERQIDM